MWGASTVRSYEDSDDSIRQTIKLFITKVVTAVNNHNKLYAITWKYMNLTLSLECIFATRVGDFEDECANLPLRSKSCYILD